jgi:hypothetical protein
VGLIHVKRDEGAKLASGVTSDDVFGAPGQLLRGFKHFLVSAEYCSMDEVFLERWDFFYNYRVDLKHFVGFTRTRRYFWLIFIIILYQEWN